MTISEFLDNHTWEIVDEGQTQENYCPDIDDWLYDDTDYIYENFISWMEDDRWRFFERTLEFRKQCGESYKDDNWQSFDDWFDEKWSGELWDFLLNQDIGTFYEENVFFKNFAKEYYNDHYDSDIKGELNSMDVADACYSATYDFDLQEYINEHKDEYQEEFTDYIRDAFEEYKEEKQKYPDATNRFPVWLDTNGYYRVFDEWIQEEKNDELEQKFSYARIGDDYYPIWLECWEFPYGDAESLNEEYRHSGLVFFEIHKNDVWETFVSLTGCGMDMSPILYHAYFMHQSGFQDEDSVKEILCKIQNSNRSYFEHVVGSERMEKLVEEIGRHRVDQADAIGRQKSKEFDDSLKALTKARDEGELNQTTTGLLGMAAFFKSQKCEVGEPTQSDTSC